jgi:flavodoxin
MKTLVAFYSKTGNTRKLAKKIADILNADLDEIIDKKSRKGVFGWLGGAGDAARKRLTGIEFKNNPAEYDLVIIGTPVWANTMVPAVRTYINEHKFENTALFCTYGGSAGITFADMEEQIKTKPVAVLGLKDREIDHSDEKIEEFCRISRNIDNIVKV